MSPEEAARLGGAAAVAPNMKFIELIAHLPSGPRTFKPDEVVAFDPVVAALAWRDKDGRIHQLHGAALEAVFEESKILRVA